MNTFLTAQSLTLSHSTRPLFESLSFTIHGGDKIGLIGHNGCGKSSLLKLLSHQYEANEGHIATASSCLISYVEQHIPPSLQSTNLLNALSESLNEDECWRAELLLAELGFSEAEWHMPVTSCSGGQQMRLLLARAIINQPDLLLLDEPSNHLDLASLIWLEAFLHKWKGAFVLVSHDQTLLDSVTNTTWIMRDKSLHHFSLPCTQARNALKEKDEQDLIRHNSEQKEINRIEKSAKRLATWGKVYDNEDLARKAKTMMARKERLEEDQTELTEGSKWHLSLKGEALTANRLVALTPFIVTPRDSEFALFNMPEKQIKSGDRIAVLGHNGCGKSSLLNLLYRYYLAKHRDSLEVNEATQLGLSQNTDPSIIFHDRCRLGYYDQSLQQLKDNDPLTDALSRFTPLSNEDCKHALISAGFEYARHNQKVMSLSGGERARLLFVGLTLARYHLLFLDEPNNHLDMEGKEALIETLNTFEGAAVLVSHDRCLIEQSCNRFWFIQNGELTEYLSADEVYQQISEHETLPRDASKQGQTVFPNTPKKPSSETHEDALLERLIALETLLEEDLNRKEKRQKPLKQKAWREEIAEIQAQL